MYRVRGFTLLEVLVAVLIFSIGLLGMAGLMVVSVKTNQTAYLRTQASFVAQSIADRIRLNRPAGPQNYNGTFTGTLTPLGDPCSGGNPCTRAQVITRDQNIWRNQLGLLPNATGTIACAGTLQDATLLSSPFNGNCTVTVAWNEASLDKGTRLAAGSNAPTTQTFAWVFQP